MAFWGSWGQRGPHGQNMRFWVWKNPFFFQFFCLVEYELSEKSTLKFVQKCKDKIGLTAACDTDFLLVYDRSTGFQFQPVIVY